MKYIKIVNILVIIMILSTLMLDNVKASSNYYRVNVEFDTVSTEASRIGTPEYCVYININGARRITDIISVHNFMVNHSINTMTLNGVDGYIWVYIFPYWVDVTNASFRIYMHNTLLVSGHGLGTHTLNLPCPSLGFPIPYEHALNFTLAAAMAIPTMTIGVVDDIMLIIGKYINCGITKFAIRAVLSKYVAKGVAVTVAIAGISYLFAEFADEIYYSIFATIPEVHPGDTVFHESEIHQVMEIIKTQFPVSHVVAYSIEQSIREQVDAYGMILISEVMTIVRQKHEEIIHDIYKETPGFFPQEIVVNKEQVPEVMELIDEYFPVEMPIRNIIEQEIYRNIDNNEFNEIPFSEVIDIIEEEQNIFIPEVPTETPQEQQEYIDGLIDKVIYEDVFIPISATPFIFEGIPATPTVPRTPKRPKEKIHTFPFYSIFVDPLADVIGITLAHLFTAMMIIGAIISIGAAWGSIGAIIAGFIGTITTAYFGLTSWLIPVFLIMILIIYANIRIKTGVGKE
ncbi:MAG: hypothetical protein HF967_07555 [Methanosarcinales archaeon]|nr:hypothetical protein [Methanosarcinales archaeon]